MKSTNNKSIRKFLLMSVAVVLVAAISVGATLAYLTAETDEKINSFTALNDIDGKVVENFDNSFIHKFVPNKPISKDPMIDNNSENEAEIYVAAKLNFYIWCSDSTETDKYEQVNYATFSKFVDITTLPTDAATTAATTNAGETEDWLYIKEDGKSRYYLYNALLKKDDGDTAEGKVKAGDDTSAPIFSYVTVKKGVNTDPDNGEDFKKAALSANLDTTKIYKKFAFQISVTGYGVNKDEAATPSAALTKLKGIMGIS